MANPDHRLETGKQADSDSDTNSHPNNPEPTGINGLICHIATSPQILMFVIFSPLFTYVPLDLAGYENPFLRAVGYGLVVFFAWVLTVLYSARKYPSRLTI